METVFTPVMQHSSVSFSSLESDSSDKIQNRTAPVEESVDEKSSQREIKAVQLESSIMEWFTSKGVQAGNPSELLEAKHSLTLKKIMSQKD